MAIAVGGRLWLVSWSAEGKMETTEMSVGDASSLTWHGDRLWVANAWQLSSFVDSVPSTSLASRDGEHLLLPQVAQTTGYLAVTDLAITENGPVFVSGLFSCLGTVDAKYSMRPIWVPPTIDALMPETRCLLSGIALVDGNVAYVAAAGQSQVPNGWQDGVEGGGVIYSVDGSVVCGGLTLPRQPRWHSSGLIVAESGTGRLLRIDPSSGDIGVIAILPGVLDALTIHGDVAVVGHGHPSRASVKGLDGGGAPSDRAIRDGISLVDLATGSIIGTMEFLGHAGPVSAVAVIPIKRVAIAVARGVQAQNQVVVAPAEPLYSNG